MREAREIREVREVREVKELRRLRDFTKLPKLIKLPNISLPKPEGITSIIERAISCQKGAGCTRQKCRQWV
ncbi:MAG: hypothetical protein IKV29_06545, partial [Alistipes sp.]|nr:hypothetical protein [Alistipes sp.]